MVDPSTEIIDPATLVQKLQQTVADMDKKVWKCRTYQRYFSELQRRGLSDYFDAGLCSASRLNYTR